MKPGAQTLFRTLAGAYVLSVSPNQASCAQPIRPTKCIQCPYILIIILVSVNCGGTISPAQRFESAQAHAH